MRALNVSPTIVRKSILPQFLYADDSTFYFSIHFILVTLTYVTSTSSLYSIDVLCICFTCKRIESDFWAIIADFRHDYICHIKRQQSGRNAGCRIDVGELVRPLVSVHRLVLLLPDMYRLLDPSFPSVAFSVDNLDLISIYDDHQ